MPANPSSGRSATTALAPGPWWRILGSRTALLALSALSLCLFLLAIVFLGWISEGLQPDRPAQVQRGLTWMWPLLVVLAALAALPPIGIVIYQARQRALRAPRVAFHAWHDGLTGLPNRAQFSDRLAATMALARREERHVAVLMIQVERASTEGIGQPPLTDALVRMVAERLRAVTRAEDLVARVEEDVFAVQQMGRPQPEGAIRLTERVNAALSRPFALEDETAILRCSIGVAFGPNATADEATLPDHAQEALSRARQIGGTSFYEESMDTALRERLGVETDLRDAVNKGALALHFQPVIRMVDRQLVGFEALLRWPHPKRGLIEPGAFIPIAEETGLITKLGAWALRAACLEAAGWPVPVRVAVNLSPAQIRHGDIIPLVQSALEESGLAPARLEIEITESLLLEDAPATLALLTGLRAQGVRVAIDDFGTGYSSLAHLWRFPFDKLKIDRSFVSGVPGDQRREAIVDTILALGGALRLTITAEGVETQEQADYLASHGCDEVQGYFFGRPMTAEAARERLTNGSIDAPA